MLIHPCNPDAHLQQYSRSPRHRVPWWVLIWIKRSPLVFLVVSVASFSIGLVLFAYSSEQVSDLQSHLHSHQCSAADDNDTIL
jgi:hypothetical protein